MARLLGYLLVLAVLAYGLWPYYTVFRLDDAVREAEPEALAPFVDLAAIQANYAARLNTPVPAFEPPGGPGADQVVLWLKTNLARLGDAALDQAITLEWVQNSIREAARRTTESRPALFMDAIDFAFFESWNRFVIRVGPLGSETHVVLGLVGTDWRIVDLVH
ncbi:hypothetical protein CKO31_05785 [Thiohalocapsa halophila]|uniref:DUF2939 domain-containing protein n=1 Tax=Thiohalocapsa halophila TaxID=69359 RepID=A0ABS1CFH8_9GAMM|nr:DUF2939 domain-containing protein [Thiohalocapsa halophila]MBK1630264.1 hypothetical protein [Thiohalocapsa halophila]